MQNRVFSINALSELLEKDRRTIKRALRDVAPDLAQHGQNRWRIRTAVDALARYESHGSDSQISSRAEETCKDTFDEFDRRLEIVRAAPTVETRRALARKMVSSIEYAITAMRARDTADGLHPQHVELKADRVLMLMIFSFCDLCRWTKEEAWDNLVLEG